MYRLLHHHGWRKLMPRPKHPKASREAQEQFKKLCERLILAAVATPPTEEKGPLLVMAQDEGRDSAYQSPQTRFRTTRPHAASQVVRESVSVFAGGAPSLGLMTSLILPAATTAMMNLFLSPVSQTLADSFIVMQVGLCRLASIERATSSGQHSPDRATRF